MVIEEGETLKSEGVSTRSRSPDLRTGHRGAARARARHRNRHLRLAGGEGNACGNGPQPSDRACGCRACGGAKQRGFDAIGDELETNDGCRRRRNGEKRGNFNPIALAGHADRTPTLLVARIVGIPSLFPRRLREGFIQNLPPQNKCPRENKLRFVSNGGVATPNGYAVGNPSDIQPHRSWTCKIAIRGKRNKYRFSRHDQFQ